MDLADFDREAVLASFLVESEEGLDLMEQALVQMESNPSDPELLHSIFRVAHTLKGNATSLELSELAGFAHVVEDLLDVFREQQALPSADLISLLLKTVDELRAMVSNAARLGRQSSLRDNKSSERKLRGRSKSGRRKCHDDRRRTRKSSSAAKADMLPAPSHRTLRADVDKLDHMLNLTGELVIAQSRLRQMIEKLDAEQGRAILEMHREAERLYMDLQN